MKINKVSIPMCAFVFAFVAVLNVSAAPTSTFNQTINSGTLTTDILNASGVSVASPAVGLSAKAFSFTCQSGGNASTGTFGSDSERIYVTNGDAADGGWTLGIAATGGATAEWSNGGSHTYDFNDAGTSGCTDGVDTDTKAGQLTVNPSAGAITTDCTSCTATSITQGSSAAFAEGTVDSVNLLTAASGADDVWKGYLTGAALSQTIPAETPAASYSLNMTLTAAAV